jgi:hypothetical protein
MTYLPRILTVAVVAIFAYAIVAASDCEAATPSVVPLQNAHAHNDYLHKRPLLDAIDQGFGSVEADIFLVEGKLLVGHTRGALKPDRTLEALYLAPLAERVHANGGHVYAKPGRFFLLVDIKDDPRATYGALQKVLARYSDILTAIEAGKVRPGAVTVVLTGNRPTIDPADSHIRYAGLDGRLTDLSSRAPAHFMPMISDNWSKNFTWKGTGSMPLEEQSKLQSIVKRAHAAGRVVRFWETPENEAVWRELRTASVDLINTDQLARLANFLNGADEQSRQ